MTTLNVSNIQHFSVGDGPGIRTTLFLKGCNLRCPWCHNPETVSPKPQELFFKAAGKRVSYGRLATIDEVMAELLEDEAFYGASGGGVTVSGGEPLLQSEAVAVLLSCLKERGVSTLIDTAGDVPWACFERVRSLTDHFYFDVKTGSDEAYANVVKANPARVFENLGRLIELGATVSVRIPLIPDFNTSEEACRQIGERLTKMGVTAVDLLPFHRLGSAKYEALGLDYPYANVHPQPKSEIAAIRAVYEQYFTVTVEK